MAGNQGLPLVGIIRFVDPQVAKYLLKLWRRLAGWDIERVLHAALTASERIASAAIFASGSLARSSRTAKCRVCCLAIAPQQRVGSVKSHE